VRIVQVFDWSVFLCLLYLLVQFSILLNPTDMNNLSKRSYLCFSIIFLPFYILLLISCDEPRTEMRAVILEPIQPIFNTEAPTQAIGGNSEQMLAQTFTVQRDGVITGVYLPIGCSDGALDIEIRNVDDDTPGSVILTGNSFEADEIRSGVGVFERLRFPEISVIAGQRLSFVLKNDNGSCGMSRGPVGDSYTGGEAWFDARPNAPGWRPLTIGTGIHDLVFLVVLELD
jgi:hypothetical protein